MSRQVVGNVLAGLIAGALFLAFLFALGTGWIWALVAAVAGYAAALLLLARPGVKQSVQYPVGLNKELAAEVIGQAQKAVEGIRGTARGLPEGGVRAKALHVCDTADKIVAELRRDPKDIQQARQFLNYYLDATGRIVKRYSDISGHASTRDGVQRTLARVEPTLEVIDGAFERQLESLLHDDVLDLEAEISLLERTVKMEDLLTELPEPADGKAAP